MPPALLKRLRFKLEVTIRSAGWSIPPAAETSEALPTADDPWLAECVEQPDCAAALAERLEAACIVFVTLRAAGGKHDAAVLVWSRGSPPQSRRLRSLPPRELEARLPETVREALAAIAAPHGSVAPAPQATPPVSPPLQPESFPTPVAPLAATPAPVEPPGAAVPPAAPPELAEPAAEAPAPVPETEVVPEACIDIFDPGAAAAPEPAPAAGEGAVFVKPKVLLLPVRGLASASTRNSRALAGVVDSAMLAAVRLPRIDFVVHCSPAGNFDEYGRSQDHRQLTLDKLRDRALHGVEWVFAVDLARWQEKKEDERYVVESELGLVMHRVEGGELAIDREEAVAVPGILDRLIFIAQDAAHAAEQEAMKAAGSALSAGGAAASKLDGAMDAARVVAGEASRLEGKAGELAGKVGELIGKSPEDLEYEYRLTQNLGMAGEKLALAVKQHPRFRLASPVVAREDDEAGIAVGASEGLRLNETYLFHTGDPTAWDGFGRVTRIGPGGSEGRALPSYLDVIADYDSTAGGVQAIEYPLIGIQLGVVSGLVPVRHGAAILATGAAVSAVGPVVPGFSLDTRLRIPWLPIAELYETNTASFVLDRPLSIFTGEIGLEKRWLWGRVSPSLAARYLVAWLGLPIPDPEDATKETQAQALAHGTEVCAGLGLVLHPVLALQVQAGYRFFFRRANQFTHQEVTYYARDFEGEVWAVDLSGPVVKLSVSYEL